MERIPLHSWEMEFSIQYHVTINSQLNDQNSIRYYIMPIKYHVQHIKNPIINTGNMLFYEIIRNWFYCVTSFLSDGLSVFNLVKTAQAYYYGM